MSVNIDTSNSSNHGRSRFNFTEGRFLFKCNQNKKVIISYSYIHIQNTTKSFLLHRFTVCTFNFQILASSFHCMLKLHNKHNITIIQGNQSWTIQITGEKFGAGWTEFQKFNLLNKDNYILLRQIGNLNFDVIQFTELKMHSFSF